MAAITLEEQVADHADELFALLIDPELHRFTPDQPPISLDALRQRLARLESRQSPDGRETWLNWVIRLPDGRCAGFVQATLGGGVPAYIAVVLGRSFWGQGLASAAILAMLSQLQARHGVRRVRATIDPNNARSIRLFTGLGLVPTCDQAGADLVVTGSVRQLLMHRQSRRQPSSEIRTTFVPSCT
ncbi:MAG: GNAT family N-acetyltransferase [Croceibacterium sp.]